MIRPDYICCVLTGLATGPEHNKTWCGQDWPGAPFVFLDANHAALTRRGEGRLLVCPECAEAISKTLKS